MNKTAIKNFAILSRRELIESVTKMAKLYEIEKDQMKEDIETSIKGDLLSPEEKKHRKELVNKIKKDGFEETIEEVAYTWFNRFIAIRFMEVNGYLPSHVRVFSAEDGSFNPEILSECMTLEMEGLDKAKVIELYNAADKDELFQYLFITQCNELGEVLPGMFEKLSDYTELLLPSGLLKDDSVIKAMVEDIPEKYWKEQVQIIGWMYQYYNTELNNLVYDGEMSKEKISKELIPAATTIYTPDWAAKYMVENSLGRLWVEGHPDDSLKKNWKYYIEEAEQEPEVEEKLEEIRQGYAELEPKDIKIIDPCVGSGHLINYTFDVLIQIYESYGYKSRDAARMIIENNLYGLDIDERARQLSYFSVMMKARQYDRRFLGRDSIPQPKIYAIDESNVFTTDNGKYSLEYFIDDREELKDAINSIVHDMIDSKEYGSIIDVRPVDFEAIYERFGEFKQGNPDMYTMLLTDNLLPLVEQAEVLSQKYDVVVTNPPYLGSNRFNKKLNNYVKENYKNEKSDLSMVMYKRALSRGLKKNGLCAFITTTSWMTLKSFEQLRINLFENYSISSLIDFGTELFEGKVGHNPIVSWVTRKSNMDYTLTAVRLVDYCYSRRNEKQAEFFNETNRYETRLENFKKIPGMPISYWAHSKIFDAFISGKALEDILDINQGLITADNNRFIRLWYEVEDEKCKYDSQDAKDLLKSKKKWIPYNKGGQRRL